MRTLLVFLVKLLTSIAFVNGIVSAQAIEVGLSGNDRQRLVSSAAQWQWALRGGGLQVSLVTDALPKPGEIPLIVIEGNSPDPDLSGELEDWVSAGGILLISGTRSLLSASGPERTDKGGGGFNETLGRLAGVRPDYYDPGLIGAYPLINPNVAEIFGGGSPESSISGGCTECCQPERSFALREDWQREYRPRKCCYTGQRSGSSPKISATLGLRPIAIFSARFAPVTGFVSGGRGSIMRCGCVQPMRPCSLRPCSCVLEDAR